MAKTSFTDLSDTITFESLSDYDSLVTAVVNCKKLFTTPTLILGDTGNNALYDATYEIQMTNSNGEDVSIQITLNVTYDNNAIATITTDTTGSKYWILEPDTNGKEKIKTAMSATTSAYSYAKYAIMSEALKLANACHTLEVGGKDIIASNVKNAMPTTVNNITGDF